MNQRPNEHQISNENTQTHHTKNEIEKENENRLNDNTLLVIPSKTE